MIQRIWDKINWRLIVFVVAISVLLGEVFTIQQNHVASRPKPIFEVGALALVKVDLRLGQVTDREYSCQNDNGGCFWVYEVRMPTIQGSYATYRKWEFELWAPSNHPLPLPEAPVQ